MWKKKTFLECIRMLLNGTVMQNWLCLLLVHWMWRLWNFQLGNKALLLRFLLWWVFLSFFSVLVFFLFPIPVSTCSSYLNTQVKKSWRTGFLWHCTVEAMVTQWHNEVQKTHLTTDVKFRLAEVIFFGSC